MIQQKYKWLLLAMLCLRLAVVGYSQTTWKMGRTVLQTRWAKDVSTDKPLNEYPRPQLVRKGWINLNGLWNYAITDSSNAVPPKYDGDILVPYPPESALSGVKKMLQPNERLWYKRSFDKPKMSTGGKVLLHFGAVDYRCWVYVNGREIGAHEGGYTAFSFDITSHLKEGQNEIIVKVFDPTDQGYGPHGKQVLNPGNIYYTPSSGIWQTVWMEIVPASYIKDLVINTDIDKRLVNVITDIEGDTGNMQTEAAVFFNEKQIASEKRSGSTITLNITHPELWSAEKPNLYTVQVRLLKDGKLMDKVTSYFGMRKVEIKKDSAGVERIFVNNKYTYNLGVLDQGFWPEGLYTAPTDEALAFDIKAIKAMGFNTIRKHIKIEPARWYYWADKMGIMVWQDFVNPNQGLPAGAKEAFEEEMKETVFQLRNHPCITTWVLFNERWGQYDQARLTAWIKQYDRSRIINGHSGELLYVNDRLRDTTNSPYVNSDLTDVHAYPNPRNALKLFGKAQVLGEFGGVGVSVPYHQWNDLQGWGYVQATPKELKVKYGQMMQQIKQLEAQGLSGSIYTQPFDVEGEENGLLTYDRQYIKLPLDTIRKMNRQLVKPSAHYQPGLAKNIDPDDTDSRYPELLRQYKSGNKDSAFLRRLMLMAMRQQDQPAMTAIESSYIDGLKDYYSKENLQFIRQIMRTSRDRGFQLFLHDSLRINRILGDYVAQFKLMDIIAAEHIAPYTSNKQTKPDWESITSAVVGQFGSLGQERLYAEQLLYYWTSSPNTDSLAKYYVLYFEDHLAHSRVHINNVSWEIFEKVNDPKVLHAACRAMEYDVTHFSSTDPLAYDTYANLLYKIGKKQEAIEWEEKALRISGNEKAYVETIEKMKSGKSTWPLQ